MVGWLAKFLAVYMPTEMSQMTREAADSGHDVIKVLGPYMMMVMSFYFANPLVGKITDAFKASKESSNGQLHTSNTNRSLSTTQ